MIKRVILLIKIARRFSLSGALDTIDQIYKIPFTMHLVFKIFSIGKQKKASDTSKTSGEKLCEALEKMGTTFIKLGQFLATRPDIIGQKLANDLEKLQDKLPPFETIISKNIIRKEIGDKQYKNILTISEPIAAASIAQVHLAKINYDGEAKSVAINRTVRQARHRRHHSACPQEFRIAICVAADELPQLEP